MRLISSIVLLCGYLAAVDAACTTTKHVTKTASVTVIPTPSTHTTTKNAGTKTTTVLNTITNILPGVTSTTYLSTTTIYSTLPAASAAVRPPGANAVRGNHTHVLSTRKSSLGKRSTVHRHRGARGYRGYRGSRGRRDSNGGNGGNGAHAAAATCKTVTATTTLTSTTTKKAVTVTDTILHTATASKTKLTTTTTTGAGTTTVTAPIETVVVDVSCNASNFQANTYLDASSDTGFVNPLGDYDSPLDCCSACFATIGCTGFTYYPDGSCFTIVLDNPSTDCNQPGGDIVLQPDTEDQGVSGAGQCGTIVSALPA